MRSVVSNTRFEGRCVGSTDYCYDCSPNLQADRYTTTAKELGECIGVTFKNGGDTQWALEDGRMFNISVPPPSRS